MVGATTGVTARLKALQPKLLSVWCMAHRLELVLKDCFKATKCLGCKGTSAQYLLVLSQQPPKPPEPKESMWSDCCKVLGSHKGNWFKMGSTSSSCPRCYCSHVPCIDQTLWTGNIKHLEPPNPIQYFHKRQKYVMHVRETTFICYNLIHKKIIAASMGWFIPSWFGKHPLICKVSTWEIENLVCIGFLKGSIYLHSTYILFFLLIVLQYFASFKEAA